MRLGSTSVVIVAVIGIALIFGACAPGGAKADGKQVSKNVDDGQQTTKKVVVQGVVDVYFANETGLPVVLCVAGLRGTASFEIDPDGMIAVQFVDDGFERVISAFTPSETTAVCYFPMVPGNFCVIIKQVDCRDRLRPASNPSLAVFCFCLAQFSVCCRLLGWPESPPWQRWALSAECTARRRPFACLVSRGVVRFEGVGWCRLSGLRFRAPGAFSKIPVEGSIRRNFSSAEPPQSKVA
jgi:hypothetical protein